MWHIVTFCYILMCFSPLLKSTLFATPNVSPPTVFYLGGWNGHHFVGNWVAETVTYHFFNIISLSSKNMQHKKKNIQKISFFPKKNFICFSTVYYWEIQKNGAPSDGKWNKIIKFVLSVKLWEEIGFCWGPPKSIYFLRNLFSLRFSEKVSKQIMFRTGLYIYFV